MKNAFESKAGQLCLAAVIGLVMGFLVGPLVTSSILNETLQFPLQIALAIISFGLAGLTIELALKRAASLAPAFIHSPDAPLSELDKIFGAGRIVYTVTPAPDGLIQLNVTAIGVSAVKFHKSFRSSLATIEGIEWKATADLDGNAFTPPPHGTIDAVVTGIVRPEASLARAIDGLERIVGKPQPL